MCAATNQIKKTWAKIFLGMNLKVEQLYSRQAESSKPSEPDKSWFEGCLLRFLFSRVATCPRLTWKVCFNTVSQLPHSQQQCEMLLIRALKCGPPHSHSWSQSCKRACCGCLPRNSSLALTTLLLMSYSAGWALASASNVRSIDQTGEPENYQIIKQHQQVGHSRHDNKWNQCIEHQGKYQILKVISTYPCSTQ